MSKLFQKKPDAEKKSVRVEIRLSTKDAGIIRASARIRNLCITEFICRAALGRRADVSFETQTILSLRKIVQTIRLLAAKYVDQGIPIPKEELGILLDEALAAMLRIGK